MGERNDDARAERLKAALRENLRRRKLQVRERGEADAGREPLKDPADRPPPPGPLSNKP